MFTTARIKEIICEIEVRFPVKDWTVEGVSVWPLIRIDNYMKMSAKALETNPVKTRTFHYAKFVIFNILKFTFSRSQSLSKRIKRTNYDTFILGDTSSYIDLEGKTYHRFSDPLRTTLSKNGSKCLVTNLGHGKKQELYADAYFLQAKIDWIIIKARIRLFRGNRSIENHLPRYDTFRKDVFVRSVLPSIPTEKELQNRIDKILALKRFFLKLLKLSDFNCAFIVNYYQDTGFAFILACRELGIKTVDIQHGVQGELHLAYGSWTNLPKMGYNVLPNVFWVWSEKEKAALTALLNLKGAHKAYVGGNLFMNIWHDDHNVLVKRFDQKVLQLLSTKKKNILLTLSPGAESQHMMGDTWKVIKATQSKYNWLIRLHPSMMHEIDAYPDKVYGHGIEHFNLKEASSLPLYALLRHVDLHITAQSSTVIEASEFGVPSIVTSDYGMSLYRGMMDQEYLSYAVTIEDLKYQMTNLLTNRGLMSVVVKKRNGHNVKDILESV
jgi:hypothetical protein